MADRVDLGRRRFLKGRFPDRNVIRPPWSRHETIALSCTGCGACASACPQAIIKLDSGRCPEVDFGHGECTFCGACADACAEPVFDRSIPPFQHTVLIGDTCLAARGVVCQSCGDACPDSAIRFQPRLGGPARPSLDPDRCTGCGACIALCPVGAIVASPTVEAAHV